jgi:ADP-ribosylglycohydrolase
MPDPTLRDRFLGCLLGGAVGDALGAPVEFWSHARIIEAFGADGPADLGRAYGVDGAVTDDTQMTLWTAEGLLRAAHRWETRGVADPPAVVHRAYLRWLATQGDPWPAGVPDLARGWLWEQRLLHASRAPGATCLSALRSGVMGTAETPINASKGCGGVMRVAPAGLLWPPDEAFQMGCRLAAITHGHPTGIVASGALAAAIAHLIAGDSVSDALDAAESAAREAPGGGEAADALALARDLAASDLPDPATVASLGRVTPDAGPGWVAEEALAVAALCARRHPRDIEAALRMAVTHSGDSDSTGSLCGQILGAALGAGAIPARWLGAVEGRALVEQVAEDLHAQAAGAAGWQERYPPV